MMLFATTDTLRRSEIRRQRQHKITRSDYDPDVNEAAYIVYEAVYDVRNLPGEYRLSYSFGTLIAKLVYT